MSSIKRISKNLAALFTSNGVNMLWQLVLPPIFIHKYGTALYGEWLALSASVAYLGTLNFGVQTFVNQDLTVRYHRGQMEGLHVQQSTALRLLLGIVGVAAVLSTLIFLLPLDHLLRLTISRTEASIAAYFLSLQILLNFIFGYFAGSFMVVARAHRGTHWNNIQRLSIIVFTGTAAWLREPFAYVAIAQFSACALCLIGVLIDIRVTAKDIFPTLRYWDRQAVKGIIKPSGYFGLIFASTFVSFQLPVLILQRIVGPTLVVVFTLMRTIFSMSRQILSALTQSMGPEITRLYGKGDWSNLSLLYNYSERFIFFCIPIVNLGVFAISPLLLALWLHKGGLFVLSLYAVNTMISIVMSAKEHKYNFQFSTNTHESLAKFMFLSYLGMVIVSLPMIHFFGVMGFLIAWLVTEVLQTGFIMRLNVHLFSVHEKIDVVYVVRLAIFALVALPIVAYVLHFTFNMNLFVRIAVPIVEGVLVAGVAYLTFDMSAVLKKFLPRITGKLTAAHS